MTNTYKWSIKSIFCHPNVDGKENVVFNVQYNVEATDGVSSFAVEKSQEFQLNSSKDFTPFDQLTEEQVLSWIKAAIGDDNINQIQASLDEIVTKLSNPPIINPTLPWGQKP